MMMITFLSPHPEWLLFLSLLLYITWIKLKKLVVSQIRLGLCFEGGFKMIIGYLALFSVWFWGKFHERRLHLGQFLLPFFNRDNFLNKHFLLFGGTGCRAKHCGILCTTKKNREKLNHGFLLRGSEWSVLDNFEDFQVTESYYKNISWSSQTLNPFLSNSVRKYKIQNFQ